MFENEKVTDPVNEIRKKQQEKQQKLLGSTKVRKGHTLFEVNIKEHTIEPAKYEEQVARFSDQVGKPKKIELGVVSFKDGHKKVMLDNSNTIHRTVIKNPDCIYRSALNKRNLYKKLVKEGIIKIVRK